MLTKTSQNWRIKNNQRTKRWSINLKNNKRCPECPSCKSDKTCLIFWGEPHDYEWYLEAIAKKEIAPGGNSSNENIPKWECSDCKHRWGQN